MAAFKRKRPEELPLPEQPCSIFDEDVVIGVGEHCRCGRGYCEIHGTNHFSDEMEEEIRDNQVGSGAGRRVIRKRPPGDNY